MPQKEISWFQVYTGNLQNKQKQEDKQTETVAGRRPKPASGSWPPPTQVTWPRSMLKHWPIKRNHAEQSSVHLPNLLAQRLSLNNKWLCITFNKPANAVI